MSSGNMLLLGAFFLLLETMIERRGNQFQQTKILFKLVETIFIFFARRSNLFLMWKGIFQRMLQFGQRRRIFGLVKIISFFSVQRKRIVHLTVISYQPKPSLIRVDTISAVTDMGGNHILKTNLIFASGNAFSSQWKPFSFIAADVFEEVFFITASRNTFFTSEGKILFFTQNVSSS